MNYATQMTELEFANFPSKAKSIAELINDTSSSKNLNPKTDFTTYFNNFNKMAQTPVQNLKNRPFEIKQNKVCYCDIKLTQFFNIGHSQNKT